MCRGITGGILLSVFQAYQFLKTHDTYIVLWLWLCLFMLPLKTQNWFFFFCFFAKAYKFVCLESQTVLSKPDETWGSNSTDTESDSLSFKLYQLIELKRTILVHRIVCKFFRPETHPANETVKFSTLLVIPAFLAYIRQRRMQGFASTGIARNSFTEEYNIFWKVHLRITFKW